MRSWKIPVVSHCFLKSNIINIEVWNNLQAEESKFARFGVIPSTLVGKDAFIYNGLFLQKLHVRDNHVGHKFGEFSLTKVSRRNAEERKKKKIRSKNKKK